MSDQFANWLNDDGPVAVTLIEHLESALGAEAVLFPPTFAPPEGSEEKPDYVLDPNGACLVDSVGSQANRLEPMFKQAGLRDLVPEFIITIGDRRLDLLDASHRAADAVARYSDQSESLRKAFLAYRDHGNALPLAKIAPTSLVFGAWDSRETFAKIPRLIESTIRAYAAERLTRAAQFTPSMSKQEIEDAGLAELGKTLGELGLSDSPSGRTPGGVLAKGGVRRETLLNLIALRALGGPEADSAATPKLQKYILGLCLVALAAPTPLNLRQGCVLVAAPGRPPEMQIVWRDGRRETTSVTTEQALAFARASAKDFVVGPAVHAKFLPQRAKQDAQQKSEKKAARKAAAGKK